ncbi:helix-turn-helix domain-containing protein [Flavobacterium sp. Sd200]|uniref:helix-turn-helix domain-containing protein n=1 Tax=Flavobacterium sp. Sd200 TaxID=2692211 RepID=UPI001370048F|nr:helix-turn-helix transcriptional regulator [Flavobacterium sp. Sd200]MXN93042.1 helix-turn-helix domain-containing protein [Flavobacterium sp. Sd200]
MENNVKIFREAKNITQTELAEKSGISLRTVQRIEAGNALKGFTLKVLAESLDTEPENLIIKPQETLIDRAKLINLAALSGLIIPFGGVIFPLILTYRTKDLKNKMLGQDIVVVQILLSFFFSVLMIVSPFIQKGLSLKFPLFIVPLVAMIFIKLFIIIKNGISLNQHKKTFIQLNISIL